MFRHNAVLDLLVQLFLIRHFLTHVINQFQMIEEITAGYDVLSHFIYCIAEFLVMLSHDTLHSKQVIKPIMRRSAITNNDNDNNNQSSTTTNEMNHQQQKRSLEDYGFLTNLKRRRHLSPQNANIDMNNDNETISSPTVRKKTRTKSKNQSILNSSIDTHNEHNSMNDNQSPRKSSSRHTSSLISQQMNEINLPNWERICPNIDQILSSKHTQAGVFAHEVQLVQQELDALLSMSLVRENIFTNLLNPSLNNSDILRSQIRQHQEAEHIYTSKKPPKKVLPPLTKHHHHHHHHHQRQNGPHLLLDRQVSMAPIIGARIDRIWSDINTYFRKISSNDILTIENLVEFNCHLENKLEQLKSDYNNQLIDQTNTIEQLNEENYEQLLQISQLNPLITHYVDRTTLGTFQSKLYEHMGQTSPVYKTPISSPMHGRILGNNNCDVKDNSAALRISPRLHPNEYSNNRTGLFSLPNLKIEDDSEHVSPSTSSLSSLIKSKKKTKLISSPSSTIKFQQRLQLVQNYLIDQHPSTNDTVKRQLFNEIKSTKKRKTSTSISIPTTITNNEHCTDIFQTKLSTLLSLLHECSLLSSSALKRANLQSDNEQTWQKLNTIERDLETLIEKIDTMSGNNNNNNSNIEKAFENLAQLLTDWNKYEEEFDQQLEELFIIDQ
ncbi:unnamed protein product [Rotaria sordida]|uniref:Uncharacterized protein n=1 Tax=Rotaria sordida TaxID=392033 RepID=A0A818UVV6_9BILA|nr:unnamed protein product [Rotaria sordida]CAF3703669.1 unnamed protein product [Rotaria sordida]CAF3785019.1 unnamed protein product [Rotaria sordida]